MHALTESQARASLGKFHLSYASQALRIRPQYLNPGNYRACLIQDSIIAYHVGVPYTYSTLEILQCASRRTKKNTEDPSPRARVSSFVSEQLSTSFMPSTVCFTCLQEQQYVSFLRATSTSIKVALSTTHALFVYPLTEHVFHTC